MQDTVAIFNAKEILDARRLLAKFNFQAENIVYWHICSMDFNGFNGH